MNSGLYNTDTSLWNTDASRDCYPHIIIIQGHFFAPGHGYVARFASQAEAVSCIMKAGYREAGEEHGGKRFMANKRPSAKVEAGI